MGNIFFGAVMDDLSHLFLIGLGVGFWVNWAILNILLSFGSEMIITFLHFGEKCLMASMLTEVG